LNSLWGKKSKRWLVLLDVFNFKSQMDTGFDKNMVKISHFSQAYFQLGPGMLWKKVITWVWIFLPYVKADLGS
jgi:hypothetical protein